MSGCGILTNGKGFCLIFVCWKLKNTWNHLIQVCTLRFNEFFLPFPNIRLRDLNQRQGHPPRVRGLQLGRVERGRPHRDDAKGQRQPSFLHQWIRSGGGSHPGRQPDVGGGWPLWHDGQSDHSWPWRTGWAEFDNSKKCCNAGACSWRKSTTFSLKVIWQDFFLHFFVISFKVDKI